MLGRLLAEIRTVLGRLLTRRLEEGLQLGGGPRRCHEGVLEAVLLERRQRRLAAAATCAARGEEEASVESEAWSWEVRLALAVLACAFCSVL